MVVGALECQVAEDAGKRFGSPTGVASLRATGAQRRVADIVRPIIVQSLLHGPSCNLQGCVSRRSLNRLKAQITNRALTYERLDLGDDLPLEGRSEAPFFSADIVAESHSDALQSFSLTLTSSPVSWRRRRYSAICS